MFGQIASNVPCILLVLAHTYCQCLDAAHRQPHIEGTGYCSCGILVELNLLVDILIVHDYRPTDDIAMTINVLSCAMEYNIGSQCQWLLEVRSGKSVIHDQQRILLVSDLRHCLDIGQA